MLSKVEVRTDQGVLLTLPLQDLSEGYLIESIEGLSPVKATIVSSSYALLDGTQYQSSRRESRNIVMKLSFEPNFIDQTVGELRTRLYGFFMPKKNVNLRFFMAGLPPVDISGRIETFDSPMFSKEPKATISIICFDPDFYDPETILFSGNTTSTTSELSLEYNGTVDSGIKFTLLPNRSMSEITIYHRPPDDSLRSLAFVAPLVASDSVIINTSPGNKGATLVRNGVATSILYGVSPYADWIALEPGTNGIRVYAEGAPVPYTIEYTNKYGGL